MTLHPCFQPASPQFPIPTPLHIILYNARVIFFSKSPSFTTKYIMATESHRECLINTCINEWRHGIEYTCRGVGRYSVRTLIDCIRRIYITICIQSTYTKCNTDTINPDSPFCLYISSNFPEVNQRIIDTSTSLEHVYQNNPYSIDATSNPHNQKQLYNLRTFTSTQQNGINN